MNHGRRTHRLAVALTLAGLLASPAASASDPVAERLDRLAAHPEMRAAVAAPLRRAHSMELPLDLLTNKALEGAAKRVPPAVVARVLSGMVDRLAAARTQLPEVLRDRATIEASARAAMAGCQGRALLDVLPRTAEITAANGADFRRAALLCADLRAAGLASDRASALASDTVRHSPDGARFDGALVQVIRQSDSPESAGAVAGYVSEALGSGQGIQAALTAALNAIPSVGNGASTPPGLLNSKANERAGPPTDHASKAQGNGPDKTPPGLDKIPPGQDKIPPGQEKKN